jgi:large subunit ribosomal protein L28
MAKVCQITGKKPITGNRVSHANNRTKRRFEPNLHDHRFWLPSENRYITLRVSAAGMKNINKKGIETIVRELRAKGEKF